MVQIDLVYEGQLRCTATHGPSGTTLITDAPLDNQGMAESFSPTDLVAAGLAACMATIMGIRARDNSWAIAGTAIRVEKHMTSVPRRRIDRLVVAIRVPRHAGVALSESAREVLRDAALTCPVRLSLLDAIDVPVTFQWDA